MKKKLAFLLAAIMIFGAAIPMHVFAGSNGTVSKKYIGLKKGNLVEGEGSDADWTDADYKFTSVNAADGTYSYLVLKTQDAISTKDSFELTLDNGYWAFSAALDQEAKKGSNLGITYTQLTNGKIEKPADGKTIDVGTLTHDGFVTKLVVAATDFDLAQTTGYTLQVDSKNPKKAYVSNFTGAVNPQLGTDYNEVWIPLVFIVGASDTEVNVTLAQTAVGSAFTPNKYAIVYVPGEATISIDEVVEARDIFELGRITISEKTANTFANGFLMMVAPEGYEWVKSKIGEAEVRFSPPLYVGTPNLQGGAAGSPKGFLSFANSSDLDSTLATALGVPDFAKTKFDSGVYVALNSSTKPEYFEKNRVLYLEISRLGLRNARGEVYIEGLQLRSIDSDEKVSAEDLIVRFADPVSSPVYVAVKEDGKVQRGAKIDFPAFAKANPGVSISTKVVNSDPTESYKERVKELLVAKRVDFNIIFNRIDKEPVTDMWSGERDIETVEVEFYEATPLSWWAHNTTDFTLVDAEGNRLDNKVKIVEVEVTDLDNLDNLTVGPTDYLDGDSYKRVTNDYVFTIADSAVEEHEKGWVSFKVTLSAAADYVGPVYLAVSGRAIPTGQTVEKLQIAEVKAPATITTKTTNVQVGYQTVAVENIVIEEAKAGLFVKGYNLDLRLEAYNVAQGDVRFIDVDNTKVEQLGGDGLIGKSTTSLNYITVPITRSSTKTPIKFEISKIKAYLDRSVPEGHHDLSLGGDAIIFNFSGDNALIKTGDATFKKFGIVSPNYIKVATQGLNKALSKNVVVSTETPNVAIVDNESTALQAPVYIDVVTSRTMVPINFVAQALGIEAKNVIWNQPERKVIVVTTERTVEFFIDTNKFTINGAAQYMVENGVQIKSIINPSNDRSYIPFTYLAQAFGITVAWDSAKKLAIYNPTDEQIKTGAVIIESIPTFSYQ